MMSMGPPAANGTTTRIGLFGKAAPEGIEAGCANAYVPALKSPARAAHLINPFILSLPYWLNRKRAMHRSLFAMVDRPELYPQSGTAAMGCAVACVSKTCTERVLDATAPAYPWA